MSRLPLLLAAAVSLLLPASASAQDYEIKLDRPEKAGSKYRLDATLKKTETLVVTANGMVVQNRNRAVNAVLRAVVENLKVDDKGNVLKKQVTIEKFTDGKGADLLKKGQVVISESVDGKTKHSLSEGTLDAKPLAALKEIIKTHEKGKPSVEEAFGTNKRRKVGESWKIDAAAAAKALTIPAKAIVGTVKLEKLETFAGQKCLKISAKTKVSAFPNAEQLKKRGFEAKSIDFQITMGGLLPVDVQQPFVSRTAVMSMKAELDGPNGVSLKMTLSFNGNRIRTPLK